MPYIFDQPYLPHMLRERLERLGIKLEAIDWTMKELFTRRDSSLSWFEISRFGGAENVVKHLLPLFARILNACNQFPPNALPEGLDSEFSSLVIIVDGIIEKYGQKSDNEILQVVQLLLAYTGFRCFQVIPHDQYSDAASFYAEMQYKLCAAILLGRQPDGGELA